MSISSLSTSSQLAQGLINGTGETDATPLSQVLAQSQTTTPLSQSQLSETGQDGQASGISQGGQMMSQLNQLATSNPTQFKADAQNISDQLAQAAKNTGDTKEAGVLNKMSQDFAEAAKTGSMSSLHGGGHRHHSGSYTASGTSSGSSTSALATLGASGTASATFGTVNSIISGVLSGTSSGSSAASATTGTAAADSSLSAEA
jgi:hypothetical protein